MIVGYVVVSIMCAVFAGMWSAECREVKRLRSELERSKQKARDVDAQWLRTEQRWVNKRDDLGDDLKQLYRKHFGFDSDIEADDE